MAIAAPPSAGNFTTYAGNNVLTCPLGKPTNVANGDILVAAIWARSNTAPYTAVTGWTEVAPSGTEAAVGTSGVLRYYTHPVTDATTEPATYTWSGGGAASSRVTGILFRVTGALSSGALDVVGAEATAVADGAGGANLPVPAVSPVGAADLLIIAQGAQIGTGLTRGAFSSPTGMSRLTAVGTAIGSGSEQDFSVDTQVLTSAGTTGVKTGTRATTTALGLGYAITLKAAVVTSVTGAVTPLSADIGVARTLTLTLTNGNGNAVTWGPVDWGDGLTADSAVTTGAGVTTKTFTRTPASGGLNKTWTAPWSQA